MKLSIPPKKAVKIIDKFVKTGSELLSLCRQALVYRLNRATIGKENIEELEKWNEKLLENLEYIFQDSTPVLYIKDIIEEKYLIQKLRTPAHEFLTYRAEEMLEEVLPMLRAYYSEISEKTESILYFASKTSQICFLDMVCDIEPDSNEYIIAKYMLENTSYGENIDFETLWRNGFGEKEESYDKKAQKKLRMLLKVLIKKL